MISHYKSGTYNHCIILSSHKLLVAKKAREETNFFFKESVIEISSIYKLRETSKNEETLIQMLENSPIRTRIYSFLWELLY